MPLDDETLNRRNRTWDASLRRSPAAAERLDPTFIEAFDQVQALDDAPAPFPIFVRRLEETLMDHAIAMQLDQVRTGVPPAATAVNGRSFERTPGRIRPVEPERRLLRIPLAAAILLLLTIGGGLAIQHLAPSGAPDDAPRLAAIQVATPGAGECTVPPRTAGPTGASAARDALLPLPIENGFPGVIIASDQIPRGELAPPDVVAGITETLQALDACPSEYPSDSTEIVSEEASSRILALYSDDYLRGVATTGTPPAGTSGFPPAWHPKSITNIGTTVEDAWLLPDGRVSAVISSQSLGQHVVIFVRVGEWWLIDELAWLATDHPPLPGATPPFVPPDRWPVSDPPPTSVTIAAAGPGFAPSQVIVRAEQDVAVTLQNVDPAHPANFTIDQLNISVDVAPGEQEEITLNAPAGVYAFYSDIPGQALPGMVGTLIVVDASIATPS